MIENKKNKSIIEVLIITIIVLLCVTAYLAFEKINENKNNTIDNTAKIIKNVADLPQNLNELITKIEPVRLLNNELLETNFKNYQVSYKDINFTFDCSKYVNYNEEEVCEESKVSFNNISFNLYTNMIPMGCGVIQDILIYKDYIIVYSGEACGYSVNFLIYDKLGNLLYSPINSEIYDRKSGIRAYISINGVHSNTFNIVDDILYYTEIYTNSNRERELMLKYIDLSASKLESEVIGSIKDASWSDND